MENNENKIINEPATLSPSEAEQIARIIQNLKPVNPAGPIVKPPVVIAPSVTENKPEAVVETPVVTVKKLTKEEYDRIKNSPPVAIPPQTMAKMQEVVIQNMANERAAREPFPDITSEAFDTTTPEIEVYNLDTKQKETIVVRSLVPADIRTFKLVNSPLYKLIVGEIQAEADAMTQFRMDNDSVYDLVYQFTVDSRTAYKLAKKGADAFHEEAFELAHKYSAGDLLRVTELVIGYIGMVNSAKADFGVSSTTEEVEEDKKKA